MGLLPLQLPATIVEVVEGGQPGSEVEEVVLEVLSTHSAEEELPLSRRMETRNAVSANSQGNMTVLFALITSGIVSSSQVRIRQTLWPA